MEHFVEYLQSRSIGEGAKSIYQRFENIMCYAIAHEVMLKIFVKVWCVRWMNKYYAKILY